jgi:hypothetical protein
MVLAGRYRQAAESFQEAEEYFDRLCTTLDKGDIQAWNAEISAAESKRFRTPDSMDMMGTRQVAAVMDVPDIADHQPNLGNDWIALALTVEERQYVFQLGR